MKLILLTCLGMLYVLSVQGSDNYHCLRNKQTCANTAPCTSGTGICACANNEQDEDCRTPAATADACSTKTDCVSKGTKGCYEDADNSDTETCFCLTDFAGDTCEKERLKTVCTADEIKPEIIPYVEDGETFNGEVYVKAHRADTAKCHLTGAGTAADPKTKTIPTADCGTEKLLAHPETSLTGNPVGTKRSLVMIVQYNPDFISTLDLEVKMSCFIGDNDMLQSLPVEVANVKGDTGFKVPVKVYITTMTGLTLTVTDDNDDPIPVSGITFGTVIKMALSLDTGDGYDNLFVKSLSHDPSAAPTDDTNTKFVIKDGCAQKGYKAVLNEFKRDDSGAPNSKKVVIRLNAFKSTTIVNTQQMNFFLIVQLCKSGSNACDDLACDTGTNYKNPTKFIEPIGRRKRQIDQDASEVFQMSFLVLSPESGAVLDNQRVESERCLQKMVFLIPLVVLVIVCLVSMAMAMYFCVKLSSKKKQDGQSDGGLSGPYKG